MWLNMAMKGRQPKEKEAAHEDKMQTAEEGHQAHHGRVVEIAPSEMLSVEGVIGFVFLNFSENAL